MIIKNINGTTEHICKCGSWLQHWANFSGSKIPCYCAVLGCSNIADVGAHVNKEGGPRDWYIVPLCHKHNQTKYGSLNIKDVVKLVPAAVNKTCGK